MRRSAMIEFYGVRDVYSESGVNLTLLRENACLSVEERWENKHQALLFRQVLRTSSATEGPPNSAPPSRPEDNYTTLLLCLVQVGAEFALVGGMVEAAHGLDGAL